MVDVGTAGPAGARGAGDKRNRLWGWLGLLFLAAACAVVVAVYQGNIWSVSYDVAHHYALVARLEEFGNLPATPDPTLQEMNIYPRVAHMAAAQVARVVGSPLAGMQFVALLSVALVWAALAMMIASLPPRALWIAAGVSAASLAVNALFIHLELFGNELIANYFFAQLVAQAAAMIVLGAALYLEKAGHFPVLIYAVIAGMVPIIQQIHSLAAIELLGVLGLLVVLDFFTSQSPQRGRLLALGAIITGLSLVVTVFNPAFTAMRRIATIDGLLILRFTPNAASLVVEAAVVIALSAALIWKWWRLADAGDRRRALVFKYWALFGAAAAVACILQVLALQLGFGSLYAGKKYAFGMNTALFLDLALLVIPSRSFALTGEASARRWAGRAFQSGFAGLFVLASSVATLPLPPQRIISVAQIIPVERFAYAYREPHPGTNARKYDYALGLFPGLHNIDYLISIGVLRAPRDRNADDVAMGKPIEKRAEVGRIFTRIGSTPWDLPQCRLLTTEDGFAILDGGCVLAVVQPAK